MSHSAWSVVTLKTAFVIGQICPTRPITGRDTPVQQQISHLDLTMTILSKVGNYNDTDMKLLETHSSQWCCTSVILADAAGHFLYTNGDRASRSAVARLRSNTITLTSYVNFTFWYNMNGNGIGNVSLIRENNDTSAGIVLWIRHGRQGFNWLESHISLNPGTFQVRPSWYIWPRDHKLRF